MGRNGDRGIDRAGPGSQYSAFHPEPARRPESLYGWAPAARAVRGPVGSDRHVLYHRFAGSALRLGIADGTVWAADGLRIDRPTSRIDYVDPFALDCVDPYALDYVDPYDRDSSATTYEGAQWTSPVIPVQRGFTELIPSWEAETPDQTWIQLEVRGRDEAGNRSDWFTLARWCVADPASGGAIHRTSVAGQSTDIAAVWADTLHVAEPHRFRDWQVRVTLYRPLGSDQTPVLRLVGAVASQLPGDKTVPVSPPGRACGTTLAVPTFSQEVHTGHYPQWDNGGEAWCSATSTAMVLAYWRTGPRGRDLDWVEPPVDAEVDYTARGVFDHSYGGTGNWAFNTAYAAAWGLKALVTRLRSFTEAEELIMAGIPVIISVSFAKGELTGAGYGTNGHLMVLVGFDRNGDVVVNDPASHLIADNRQVRCVYPRGQLENAWAPHSGGTVYLIHPAEVALPRVLDRHEPNWA